LFRAHLLECADCRARVGELRAIAHDLASVERDEQRVRQAQAVDTKSREVDAGEQDAKPRRPRRFVWLPRVAAVVGVGLFVLMAAYTFALRASVERLEQALDQRLEATAAMEHGAELEIAHQAPGVVGTARVNDNKLALLVEGLSDERTYALYLLAEADDESRTLRREPLPVTDGKAFVLLGLGGREDRLVVTRPEGGVSMEPDGMRIFEVLVGPASETVGG
jgi:hypothetical protein